ncbi:MAG: S8 family peptidase [Phycisphaerales bacterium]
MDSTRAMALIPWRLLVAAGALGCFGVSGAIAAPGGVGGGGDELYYSYFDDRVSLTLDETRLVVTDLSGHGRGAVEAFAAGFGIDADGITPHEAPNTWIVEAPGWGVADLGTTRELVSSMARESREAWLNDAGAADLFISPMLGIELGPVHISDGIIVRFAEGTTPEQAEAIVDGFIDAELLEADMAGMAGVFRFVTSSRDGFEVLEAANRLAALDQTVYAEPHMSLPLKKALIPNDPLFGVQWGLRNIGQSGGLANIDIDADLAWDITPGFATTLTAILDDGVEQDHPDIHQVPGIDVTGQATGGGPAGSCDNHGTAVGGVVSAIFNNGAGVAGAAPGTRIISVKFSNSMPPCTGSGSFFPASFASGLNNAFSQGARVSNNSNSMGASGTIDGVYQTTRNSGMVHFASSGNANASSIAYPSSLATVNSVGSVSRTGFRSAFSNYGAGLAFTAPGDDIWTTDRTGGSGYAGGSYTVIDGTSFSSPMAAGVAALVKTVNPALTAAQVEQILQDNAKDRGTAGYDTFYGWGIPDADDSMEDAIALLSPPGNITLVAPAEGLMNVDPVQILQFAWTTTPAANFYRIEIDDDQDFSSPEFVFETFQNLPLVQLAGLQVATQYYWRSRGINFAGEGTSTPSFRTFFTVGYIEPSDCEGDLNGDDVVDSDDLGVLLGAFGGSGAGDLDGDGDTDSDDLGILLSAFGTNCL